MSKELYVVNKTATNLQMKRGFFQIPRDGYKPVTEADLEHPDFEHAKSQNWIEITDKKPADAPAIGGVKPIEMVTPYRGMSLDELRASEKDEPAKKTGATSSAIGKPAEPEADDVQVETPTETVTKTPKKKAAAEKAAE